MRDCRCAFVSRNTSAMLASGLAHFFFAASGMSGESFNLMATHPPLEERMKTIDPNYERVIADVKLPDIEKSPEQPEDEGQV